MIRPGLITQSMADELNRALSNQGTGGIFNAGTVGTSRGAAGGFGSSPSRPDEWWSRLTAVSNDVFSHEQYYQPTPGTWAVQPFGESGTFNAYPASIESGFTSEPVNAAVGQIVRMWRSQSIVTATTDAYEFAPLFRQKIHGILQSNLTSSGSADMLIVAFNGSIEDYARPSIASQTVWGFLLPTNFTVFQGEYVSAFYDVWSQRFYADGWFQRNPVLAGLSADLNPGGTATATIVPGTVSAGGMTITVRDGGFLKTGEKIPSGSAVLAWMVVTYANNPLTPSAAAGEWYAIGNPTTTGAVSGTFTVGARLTGGGTDGAITVVNGSITSVTPAT